MPRQTTATLNLDVAAEPSLASSLNPSNLELTLNPTPLGTQVTGELTTTVTTDNPTGYKLTLQTKTNNTSLTHLNGIDTIPMTTNSTPNTLINNTWGFNPTSSATTFQSIPADGQTPYTLKQTTSATSLGGEASTVIIGAKANTSIPAGLYTNVITFTATANPLPPPTPTITTPTANQIFAAGTTSTTLIVTTDTPATCYYGTATNPTTAMATTGSTTHTQSVTGLANQSTNTRYIRCTAGSGDTTSDYSPNQSVTFYVRAATPAAPTLSPANGATINTGTTTITVTSGSSVCTWGTTSATASSNASGATRTTTTGANTLYYSCILGTGNTASTARTGSWSYTGRAPVAQTDDPIQGITDATCPTSLTIVRDTRDDHRYAIQKLADGKCWMLTNLAYGGSGAGTQLTSGGGQTTTTNQTVSSTNWNQQNPPYNNQRQWVNPTTAAVNQSTGTRCAVAYRTTAASINSAECGYLYNWCAALGNASSACAQASGDVPNAGTGLCPSGWRLPTGGSSGEFQAMYTAIGGARASLIGASSTWRGVYSGVFNAGYGLNNQSSSGFYWSSTANLSAYSYILGFDASSSVYPASTSDKYVGFAVRCVAAS